MVTSAPVEIKKYRCSKCNTIIEGTYKEAQAHMNLPVDTPLPEGLVFMKPCPWDKYIHVTGEGIINGNHTITHKADLYCYHEGEFKPVESIEVTSESVKEGFGGRNRFLTEEEFDIFKNKGTGTFPRNAIRKTPELEKLASRRSW